MDSLNCEVCFNAYNDRDRKPHIFTCGHTNCAVCVNSILAVTNQIPKQKLKCPYCRAESGFEVKSVNDLPVNYAVLNIIKEATFKSMPGTSKCLLKGVKEEVEMKTTGYANQFDDVQSRLMSSSYTTEQYLDYTKCVMENMELLARYAKYISGEISKTQEDINELREVGTSKLKVMEMQTSKIKNSNSLTKVAAIYPEIDESYESAKEWLKSSRKVIGSDIWWKTKKFVGYAALAIREARTHLPQNVCSHLKSSMSPEHVVNPRMIATYMLSNEAWTIKATCCGKCKYSAKLSERHGQYQLHAFKKGPPPESAVDICYPVLQQFKERKVFMEFSYEKQVIGRIVIQLNNNEGRTKQFEQLCSGEKGPSYRNTYFLEKETVSDHHQALWGGDYRISDDTHGDPFAEMKSGKEINVPARAGVIGGFYPSESGHKPFHFVIYCSDIPDVIEDRPIGKVIEGLDCVQYLLNFNVQEVSISDCGILLNFNQKINACANCSKTLGTNSSIVNMGASCSGGSSSIIDASLDVSFVGESDGEIQPCEVFEIQDPREDPNYEEMDVE